LAQDIDAPDELELRLLASVATAGTGYDIEAIAADPIEWAAAR
jgi:hypothetical protein